MKKIYLIILFAFISACGYYNVYFNTFYNAKKYYTEAKSAKEKNDNKINSNIKRTFDKSIAKCAYVIKEYPKSKYVDDALFLMGQCFFEQENYIKALKKFQEIEQYYSKSPSYPIAKLYLGRTYLKLKKFDKAKNQFNIIFNNDEFITVREQAYLYLSEYYLQEKDYIQAKTILQYLIKMKISKESYLNALFQYAQIEYQNEKYENALVTFKKLLSNNIEKRMKLNTRFHIGETYIKLNQYKKAKNQFEKLKKDEIISDKIKEIDLQIGICNAYLGDTETAFSTFEKLINENKGKQIANKAYYHWGEIYFSLLQDYENAVEKLQKVQSKKDDKELLTNALQKIKTANQFITYKLKQDSDNILELVEAQFNIAEYYNLDLSLPDSAIAIYDKIINQLNILNEQSDSLNILLNNFIEDSLEINIQDSLSFIPDSLTVISVSDTTKSDIDTLLEIINEDSLSFISDSLTFAIEIDSIDSISDTLSEKSNKQTIITKESILAKLENLQSNIEYYQNEVYPKALFLKAWILINIKNDTLFAQQVVARMETDFPESKYLFAAKRMINNEPYEITSKYEFESQSLFEKSMNYYDKSISLEKSISYLDTIITNYPESEIYPEAIYAKAHLLITGLRDSTAAKPYLIELTQDFPQHELTDYIITFFDGKNFIKEISQSDSSIAYNISLPDSNKSEETTIQDTLITIETSFIDSSKVIEISKSDSIKIEEISISDSSLVKDAISPDSTIINYDTH
ncbi:MAG: tetratricopeptide repeat protein, partial [Candidatus Cloacimonetes bacterium]|nr:tetratricopeptide repeat protein [Candidatus Cloacimonadota bacterium]